MSKRTAGRNTRQKQNTRHPKPAKSRTRTMARARSGQRPRPAYNPELLHDRFFCKLFIPSTLATALVFG